MRAHPRFAGRREILVVPQPLFRLPKWLVVAGVLLRLLGRLGRFLFLRHPMATAGVVGFLRLWSMLDTVGLLIIVGLAAIAAGAWRWRHPLTFIRYVALPLLGRWRQLTIY
jgi:hypothetical protein